MTKILVIGSEGNVGRVLCPYLAQKGHIIYKSDIKAKDDFDYIQADINIPIDLAKVFWITRPDVVFLLAGQVSRILCEKSGTLAITTNIAGTYNIIELCKMYDAKLLFASTSEVYGNQDCIMNEDTTIPMPNNRYGLSKYLAEQIIRYEINNGLDAIILRLFMMYHESEDRGEHRSALIRFAESLYKRQAIIIHKNSGRCWMNLDDGVIAMEKAIYLSNFDIINIGMTEYTETEQLAKIIGDKMGVNYLDYAIFKPLPGKMTLKKIPDISKMINLLGVNPKISLSEGVNRVIDSFKQNADNIIYNSNME